MKSSKIERVGILTTITKFGQNQNVYGPYGISPTIMSLPGKGGSTTALIKIIEYEDSTD